MLIPLRSSAGLRVLEGEHTVVYDIVNPRGVAFIPDYADEAFEQKVVEQDEFSKRVRVTVKMHALRSTAAFPVPPGAIGERFRQYLRPERDRQSDDPELVRLVRELTLGSRSVADAVNGILSWIADNLTFDTSLSVPADAASALRHRKAYCVGYANLAVAMLRAAGIPARVAHGYLPPGYEWGFSKDYWGVKVNDGGYHAYLEIYYPDTGWTFSDAEHSFNFVDPYHIILRIDGREMPGRYAGGYLEVDKATFYTIFQEENRTLLVDELPTPKRQRLGRRIGTRQVSGLVRGAVRDRQGTPVPKGIVVLWKNGRGEQFPFSGGRYAIPVPKAGTYRVEAKGSGFARSSVELQVKPGMVYRKDFSLAPGGVIKGRAVDAAGRPLQDGDVFYLDGRTSYGVPLDRDGSYRIEGLSPGRYKVSVTAGEKSVTRTVAVQAGMESVQDFTIP